MPRRLWALFALVVLALGAGVTFGASRAVQAEPPEPPGSGILWEPLTSIRTDTRFEGTVYRARVPGGWLVDYNGLAFYPDAKHVWDGTAPAEKH